MITVYKGRSPEMKVGLMSHAMGRRDGDRKEGEAEEHEEQEGEGKNTLIRKTKKGKNEYKTGGGAGSLTRRDGAAAQKVLHHLISKILKLD